MKQHRRLKFNEFHVIVYPSPISLSLSNSLSYFSLMQFFMFKVHSLLISSLLKIVHVVLLTLSKSSFYLFRMQFFLFVPAIIPNLSFQCSIRSSLFIFAVRLCGCFEMFCCFIFLFCLLREKHEKKQNEIKTNQNPRKNSAISVLIPF